MTIELRPYAPEDIEAIFGLINELAEFEKSPEKVHNSVERMKSEHDFFECIVATDDGIVIGMALYFYAYYTWDGKSIYLDDLYVQPAYRGRGIGESLINELLSIAKKQRCNQVRWQVLRWNEGAINLYEKLGAEIDDGWHVCKVILGEADE